MGRHAASRIHPWRGSGRNSPGYSRPPQQAVQAPQQASSDDLRVDLGNIGPDATAHLAAAQAAGVTLVEPFRADPATSGVVVRVGRHKLRIPAGWQVSTSRSRLGSHVVFVLESNDTLHVLAEREGKLWEMSKLPQEMVDDFISQVFKENPR